MLAVEEGPSSVRLAALLAVALLWLLAPETSPALEWLAVTPGLSPSARAYHAMAHDSRRGRVVLFGGSDGTAGDLGDTWVLAAASNRPPVVSAGPDVTATAGSPVELEGTASDPDGDRLTFAWEQLSGPAPLSLSTTNSLLTSFTPTTPGGYVLRLVVTDSRGSASSATAAVTVLPDYVSLRLGAGLNLLSVPVSADATGCTAQALASRSGASFVARTRLAGAVSRFEAFVPGSSPDFPLVPGEAYLVHSPQP